MGVAGRGADFLDGASPPVGEDSVSTSRIYPVFGGDGSGAGNQELRCGVLGAPGQAEVAE